MWSVRYDRVLYNDDGIEVPGILLRRWLRRPLFIPFHIGCGFDSQVIYIKVMLTDGQVGRLQEIIE